MKLRLNLFSAVLFVVSGLPLHSQTGPAAIQGGLPIVVGSGFSNFNTGYFSGNRMNGITVWVDYYPNFLPRVLRGLGIEAEGRDINFSRPSSLSRMREDTGQFGFIYPWYHYRKIHPYGKFLAGMGSIDFPPHGTYSHDKFSLYTPGGGAEFKAFGGIWLRADYQYQIWYKTFLPNGLHPNGITIGASYDFRPNRDE